MNYHIPAFGFIKNLTKYLRYKMVDIFKAWMGNRIENGATISKELATSLALPKYSPCHRVFESAVIVLRTVRLLDSRLQNKQAVDDFFDSLEIIERNCVDWKGFDEKTVIVVEGLHGSGKSAVIQRMMSTSTGAVAVSASSIGVIANVRGVFESMPSSVSQAFEFVTSYFVANEIMSSGQRLFFVEQFHHAVCVSNVCETASSTEAIQQLSKAAFEWPFDLPLPELVLFLSVSTEARLQRLQWNSSTKNPSAAAAKDHKENLVYSMICGPTTVGIDCSGSVEEVVAIVRSAFDFYGVHVPVAVTAAEEEDGKHLSTSSDEAASNSSHPHHPSPTGALNRTTSDLDNLSAFPRDNRRISMGVYGMFSSSASDSRSVDPHATHGL